jgi:hypothetical protein
MKRTLSSILIVIVLLFGLSSVALAIDTAPFKNYILKNGVNGKLNSDEATKAGTTGTQFKLSVTYISGATQAYPMCCNVYRADSNSIASKNMGQIYYTDTWCRDYKTDANGSVGIKGKNYFLKMQNSTNGPLIVVSGSLTP